MSAFLWVAFGAALGGMLRYALALVFVSPLFPAATLTANVLGGLCMGLLYGSQDLLSDSMRLFLAVGFLGGLTTFSTFSLESFKYLLSGQLDWFILHAVLHMGLSLGALCVGWLFIKYTVG